MSRVGRWSLAIWLGFSAVGLSYGQSGIRLQAAATIQETLARDSLDPSRHDPLRLDLRNFYQGNAYLPVWVDDYGRPDEAATVALGILRTVSNDGLDPSEYDSPALDRQTAQMRAAFLPVPDIAAFDIQLTLNILRYQRQLHLGRVDSRHAGFQIATPLEEHDFPGVLKNALSQGQLAANLAALAPPLAQYRGLREWLTKYRSLGADESLASLPLPSDVIKPGQPLNDVAALQHWLTALGDMSASTPVSEAVYEGAVVEGIKRFQNRHGLTTDGVIGKQTLEALHVPLTRRVRQIELALERLRWLPDLGGARFIAVDIPMFHLWAWDSTRAGGQFRFDTNVIVGRAVRHKTPVFIADMRFIEFRPSWNVPDSIVRNEILPALARDPAYLERQNMELTRQNGRVSIRQRPGPNNVLGLIKFVFPNEHAVYMHGTPAQELFSRARRDFSHGCIRLEDPVGLAEWALGEQPEWTRDGIVAAMQGKDTLRVNLERAIPVILFYVTAAVMPQDQTIHFAEDIYGHDATLEAALKKHAGAGK